MQPHWRIACRQLALSVTFTLAGIGFIIGGVFVHRHYANLPTATEHDRCTILDVDWPTTPPPGPLWTACPRNQWSGHAPGTIYIPPAQSPLPLLLHFPDNIDTPTNKRTWIGDCAIPVATQLAWFASLANQYSNGSTHACSTYNSRAYLQTDNPEESDNWSDALFAPGAFMVFIGSGFICASIADARSEDHRQAAERAHRHNTEAAAVRRVYPTPDPLHPTPDPIRNPVWYNPRSNASDTRTVISHHSAPSIPPSYHSMLPGRARPPSSQRSAPPSYATRDPHPTTGSRLAREWVRRERAKNCSDA